MAVPKKRTTKSTRGQRRAHDSLKKVELVPVKNSPVGVPRRLKRAVERGLIRIGRD